MFFELKVWNKQNKITLKKDARVIGADGYAKELALRASSEHGEKTGISEIELVLSLPEFYSLDNRDEGYALEITDTKATLYGENERALIYAAVTLLQMCDHGELYTGTVCDAPDCAFRGYRVNLPGRRYFDEFKKMMDTIVYYKYNALSLEIGGAMEYKRHPEINEKWAEFVQKMHDDGKGVFAEYNSCNWSKNSIHADNGDGDILTQDEVRELVEYGRARGLEVYPEVPTLSHTDYICMAHPEIAERDNDPYPDTYCPNHPDTYKIVFDILEEIIDVFDPKVVNIGHDELYTACKCERCRDFAPYEVYVKDVTTLYEWLKERGIRTMMWAEKLLPVITPQGKTYGGAGGQRFRHGNRIEDHPELYHCQLHLPRDIVMLHWYYPFGIQYDYVFHSHGYNAVVYGNLSAANVDQWRDRRKLGIKGGACSNWGSNDTECMQRNNQFFNLIYSSYALWSDSYDNNNSSAVAKKTFDEGFHLHYGNIEDKPYIKVTHTTDCIMPYKAIWCGIFLDEDEYRLGTYKVTYKDGTTESFKVMYGENIASEALVYDFCADNSTFDDVTLSENAKNQLCYGAVPESIDGKTYYKTVFLNPHPEKEISSVEYVAEKDCRVTVNKIEY